MMLLFATRNRGKVAELHQLVAGVGGLDLLCLDDFGELGEIEESGATFAENAQIKAGAASRATRLAALADDSGLEVDALGGRPGIHSARYAGPEATDAQRIAKLLEELRGVPMAHRTARFRCAIALALPDLAQPLRLCQASCEGLILEAPRGSGGFGYDPVFYVEQLGKTFAEAAPEQKDQVSHRGLAMRLMAELLSKHLIETGEHPPVRPLCD